MKTVNIMCRFDGTMELVGRSGFVPLTDIFVFDVSGEAFVVARYDGEMLAYDEFARREDAEKAAETLAEKTLGVLLISPEEISKKEGAA